jgi:endonuclease/exonuclease/phosphatase family metal-dependent hydrolase
MKLEDLAAAAARVAATAARSEKISTLAELLAAAPVDVAQQATQRNNGIRIDHILLSPVAADRLASVAIDKRTRGWEKPSDHVPVIIELTD